MPSAVKKEEIKRAVKEALDDKWRQDTSNQLTALGTQMTQGFTAVHTRQDITNGKVVKNTGDIDKINAKSKSDKYLWFVVTTLVGIVVFFLTRGH